MEIYFLRHGEAEGSLYNSPEADFERELTQRGRERLTAEAAGLIRLIPGFDLILTSPLVRARQSAEIFAGVFNCHDRLRVSSAMNPPTSVENLMEEIVLAGDEAQRVLVVGARPGPWQCWQQRWFLAWTRKNFFDLKKGGMLQMTMERPDPDTDAKLASFLPAEFLIHLGKGEGRLVMPEVSHRLDLPDEAEFLPDEQKQELPEPEVENGWDVSLSERPDRRRPDRDVEHPYTGDRDRRDRQYPPTESNRHENVNETIQEEVSSLQSALDALMGGVGSKGNDQRTRDALSSFLGGSGNAPQYEEIHSQGIDDGYDEPQMPRGIDIQL